MGDVDIERVLVSNKISFDEKNCSTNWDKVSADIKKEYDSEHVYNKNYLKTKIKSHRDEVPDFYDNFRL